MKDTIRQIKLHILFILMQFSFSAILLQEAEFHHCSALAHLALLVLKSTSSSSTEGWREMESCRRPGKKKSSGHCGESPLAFSVSQLTASMVCLSNLEAAQNPDEQEGRQSVPSLLLTTGPLSGKRRSEFPKRWLREKEERTNRTRALMDVFE